MAIGQSEALKFEAPYQKAGFLKRILDFDLDKDYTHKQNELLATFTKEQINALAKQYLKIDNMVILVVGDKASLFDRVKNLGYEVVELDINGNPLK
jgi:zinc protease